MVAAQLEKERRLYMQCDATTKADELNLVVDRNRESEHIVELTTYITTLSMNFFVGRRRPKRKMA